MNVLNFLIKEVRASINLKHILKVIPLTRLETVPLAPHYFVGLLNYHGMSVPVIDLALLFDLPRNEPYSLDIPIILCAIGEQKIGIIVDVIIGLEFVPNDTLQMENNLAYDSPFLGVLKIKNELFLLVNIQYLLSTLSNEKKINISIERYINDLAKQHE